MTEIAEAAVQVLVICISDSRKTLLKVTTKLLQLQQKFVILQVQININLDESKRCYLFASDLKYIFLMCPLTE